MNLRTAATIAFAGIALAGAIAYGLQQLTQERTVIVLNPCNVFVAGISPAGRKTPALRQGTEGLELLVSLAPAPDEEASSIRSALRWHRARIVINPGLDTVRALDINAHGELVLAVATPRQASLLLAKMCLANADLAAPVPTQP